MLLALVLRAPLVATAPVAQQAESGWDVGPAGFGALSTLALLCFALVAPLASLLQRRLGLDTVLLIGSAGIIVATVLRSLGGFALAAVATVLLGIAITFGNVLVPAVIRRDLLPARRPMATALYSVGLNTGTLAATAATVPLAALVGWRVAIALWAIPGLLTIAAWWRMLRAHPPTRSTEARRSTEPTRPTDATRPTDPALPSAAPPRPASRRIPGLRWLIAGAFACQLAAYYSLTAWLPSLVHDEARLSQGVAALAASLFQAFGILGALAIPLVLRRVGLRAVAIALGVLFVLLPVGLLANPGLVVAVAVVGGIAQGGVFTTVFTMISDATDDAPSTAALSAFVQTAAYLVGAAFPPIVGALHTATGGWTLPLVVVLALTIALLVLLTAAAVRVRSGERTRTDAPA